MVKIEILGGHREIGGNCIRIVDQDRTLLFDQGIRFSIFTKFYSRLIQPLGLPELRKLGVVPSQESYTNVDAIYISHLHLDHLGLLNNIPCETTVKLSSLGVYQALEESWRMSPSWLVYVPPRFFVKTTEATKYRTDKNEVLAVPVSHSAYPTNAYIYFGSDETILYTGDLRIDSISKAPQTLYRKTLLDFISENEDIKIDKLIIEGTNIGRLLTPIKLKEALEIIKRLIEKSKLTFIAVHQLDIESLLLIASSKKLSRKNLLIASPRLTKVLEALITSTPKMKRALEKVQVLQEEVKHSTIFAKTSLNEVKQKPANYCIITDIARLDEIIRRFEPLSRNLIMAPVILMITEPTNEEAIFDMEKLIRWLSLYRLQPYTVRVSGHYHPYQLKTIIQIIKPKEVMPIHTLYPEYLHALSKTT